MTRTLFRKIEADLQELSETLREIKESLTETKPPTPAPDSRPDWWPNNPWRHLSGWDPAAGARRGWDQASDAIWDAYQKALGERRELGRTSLKPIVETDEGRPKMDWSLLPVWANKWIVMDSDGRWYSYSTKPVCRTSLWGYRDDLCRIPKEYAPDWHGDWKLSLTEVPLNVRRNAYES